MEKDITDGGVESSPNEFDLSKQSTEYWNQFFDVIVYEIAATTAIPYLNKATRKITTPHGGEYLIGAIHITGPKINLDHIRNKDNETKGNLEQ